MLSWGWISGIITAGVLALDLYCWLTGKPTLSAVIRDTSLKQPLLPFGIGLGTGVLAWHFWSMGHS